MPHNAVPRSSHQSASATSLCGRTVGLAFVLYFHGHGLQDIDIVQEAQVAACLWRCEGVGLSTSLRNGQLRAVLYQGKNAETIQPGLRAACLLWLLTWLFLFCSSERGKMQGSASAQGHRDWQGASLRKQTTMCALLTLSSSLAAIFSSLVASQVLLLPFQSTGCPTIKTAKKKRMLKVFIYLQIFLKTPHFKYSKYTNIQSVLKMDSFIYLFIYFEITKMV